MEGGLGACSVTSTRRLNTALGPTDLYSVLPICRDFANAVPSPCRASASCLETPPGQQLPGFRFEPSQTHSSLMTHCTDPCASRWSERVASASLGFLLWQSEQCPASPLGFSAP